MLVRYVCQRVREKENARKWGEGEKERRRDDARGRTGAARRAGV